MHEGPYGGHIDIRMSPLLSRHLNSSIRISQSQSEIILESNVSVVRELAGGLVVSKIEGWDENYKVMWVEEWEGKS